MDRQTCTRDTVLVKSREMTGRNQTQPWWLEGGGVKTTEKKYIGPIAPEDTHTATQGKDFSPYHTGLYIFSHLFVLNVFNVGHPAERA
jgi:hypothetical protein